MAGEREIKITIVGDASKAKAAFNEVGTAAGTMEAKVTGLSGKFANFGTIVSGVVAAGAVQKLGGALLEGAKGAAEDAAAMDRLKISITNTGTSFDAYSQQVDDAITKGQELAFSDGEIMSALTALTNATGDTDEALRRLTLAQDLARGTGMSLEQASKLLGKTSDENTATLARYGIQLGENATAQDLMNEVDKRFGGQAAAFAESDAGKWAQLQLQMTELQETIGGALIPAFTFLAETFSTLMTQMEPVTAFIGEHIQPIMIGLATAITVIVIPAFVAWAVAAGAAALATITAMAPIILTAAAIGVAVAALYVAWETNFLGIQDITKAVIDFVTPYVTTAVQTIQAVFETVFPIIQGIVQLYVTAWQTIIVTALDIILAAVNTVLPAIQVIFEVVWGAIQIYVAGVMLAIQTAVQVGMFAMKDIIGPILGEIQGLFETIWGAIQGTTDAIAGPGGTIVGSVSSGMGAVQGAVESVLGAIEAVWNATWGRLASAANAILSSVKSAWNSIAGGINSAISVWNGLNISFDTGIPGVPSINWDSPNLPYLPTFGGGSANAMSGGGPGGGGSVGGPGTGGGGGGPGGGGDPVKEPPKFPPTTLPGWAGGGGGGGGGVKPNPRPPGELPPVVIDPVTGEVYSTLGPTTHGVSGHQGSGSRVGANAFAGTRVYATGSPEHKPDSLGRPWGDPCWGKLASCEVEMAAAARAAANANNPFMYQGGGQGNFQTQSSLRDRDPAAYAAKHGGVLLSSGLIGYPAQSDDAGGGVFLDGFRVGKFLGFRHRRSAFSLRDPAGSNC